MAQNIWGINPISQKPEIYALRFPESEIPQMVKEAKERGWTKVTVGAYTTSDGIINDPDPDTAAGDSGT